MATFKNESLETISKRYMINIVLFLQSQLDEANKHAVEEIRKLSDAILKLQSEIAVSQQVNSILSNILTSIERPCWGTAQYARRECLDVIGIPCEVNVDVLDEKVLNIFGKLGFDIPPDQIEACQRISKKAEQLFLISRKGKNVNKFGVSRRTFKKQRWTMLTCLAKSNFLLIEAFVHITKFYGPRANSYIV